MFMRYFGGGIGHLIQGIPGDSDGMRDDEMEVDEMEVDELDLHGYRDSFHQDQNTDASEGGKIG
jgi:hypothetical protein